MKLVMIGEYGKDRYILVFEEREEKYIRIYMGINEFKEFCKMVRVAESFYL